MSDKYGSTKEQLNGEIADMHKRMTDLEEQEKKKLRDNLKENVKRTTNKYGLA